LRSPGARRSCGRDRWCPYRRCIERAWPAGRNLARNQIDVVVPVVSNNRNDAATERRAIFTDILEFRAPVLFMSGARRVRGAALSPETALPVLLRRPGEMRVPGRALRRTRPQGPVGCR